MASKLFAFALLGLLACNTLAIPDTGRDLLARSASLRTETGASSDTKKGRASASSRLTIKDGQGLAQAKAVAETKQKASDEIKDIIIEVVKDFPQKGDKTKDEYCDIASAFIEEDALAIGEAAAEVTVETFGIVEIEGTGEGCTATEADAEAQASATVDLVINAWAEVRKGRDTAQAQARLKGSTGVLVKAAASATANACSSSDGSAPAFAEAFQNVVAKAYAKAVASIIVFLEASVDCAGETDVFAEAEVGAEVGDESTIVEEDSSSTVEGKGKAVTTADASATVTQVGPCRKQGSLRLCCRGKNLTKPKCFCNLSGRRSKNPVCEATRTLVSGKTIWQYTTNEEAKACSC